MKGISILIKPAGGMCNMRCRYCFYREERTGEGTDAGFMTEETLRAVFAKLLPGVTGPCNIVFQGGEPTLCGINFFRCAAALEREYAEPDAVLVNAIQTNGLCINDEWAEFLASEHFLTGISLDGPRTVHDRYRVDAQGMGTHARVMQAVRTLEKHGAEYNILSVVTDGTCRNAEAVYRFFDREGLRWQQYIPAIGPYHEQSGDALWLPDEDSYAAFLKTMFRLWSRDVQAGKPVHNRYFENLLAVTSGKMPEACDMRGFCSPQYVIEADGTVYPCDFYCVEEWRLGSINTDSKQALDAARERFLRKIALPDACLTCRWQPLCRGGCRRRRSPATERDRFCGAYRSFFPYAYPILYRLSAAALSGDKTT